MGGRHSSVVSSAPTILRPRVRFPSTPSMLLSICIIKIVSRKKRKNKQKEAGIGPFFKKKVLSITSSNGHSTHLPTYLPTYLSLSLTSHKHNLIPPSLLSSRIRTHAYCRPKLGINVEIIVINVTPFT